MSLSNPMHHAATLTNADDAFGPFDPPVNVDNYWLKQALLEKAAANAETESDRMLFMGIARDLREATGEDS